jgi:hypothetical protein
MTGSISPRSSISRDTPIGELDASGSRVVGRCRAELAEDGACQLEIFNGGGYGLVSARVRYAGVMRYHDGGGMTAAADARRGCSASGKRDTDGVVVLSRLDHDTSVDGEGGRAGWSAPWGVAAAFAGGIGGLCGTLWPLPGPGFSSGLWSSWITC